MKAIGDRNQSASREKHHPAEPCLSRSFHASSFLSHPLFHPPDPRARQGVPFPVSPTQPWARQDVPFSPGPSWPRPALCRFSYRLVLSVKKLFALGKNVL